MVPGSYFSDSLTGPGDHPHTKGSCWFLNGSSSTPSVGRDQWSSGLKTGRTLKSTDTLNPVQGSGETMSPRVSRFTSRHHARLHGRLPPTSLETLPPSDCHWVSSATFSVLKP